MHIQSSFNPEVQRIFMVSSGERMAAAAVEKDCVYFVTEFGVLVKYNLATATIGRVLLAGSTNANVPSFTENGLTTFLCSVKSVFLVERPNLAHIQFLHPITLKECRHTSSSESFQMKTLRL